MRTLSDAGGAWRLQRLLDDAVIWKVATLVTVSVLYLGCTPDAVDSTAIQESYGADTATGEVSGVDDDTVRYSGCSKTVNVTPQMISETVWQFDVGHGAIALTISAQRPNDSWAAITALYHEGESWLKADWWSGVGPEMHLACCARIAAWPSLALATLPSSPMRSIQKGSWQVEISAAGAPPAIAVRYGEVIGPAAMPLIVHYSDEESTPAVLEAMEAANHLVREMANIELEVLEYRLMTADDRQRLDEPTDFQPALQDTRVAAHLVFADAWEEGVSGATVVGGPLRHGAIFVAAQRLDNTRTIAHEIMHYLGLWHLTELERTDIHDPLGDTSLFDPNNLMSARADGGVELTPQQLSMVRRHPILTATCAPTIQ